MISLSHFRESVYSTKYTIDFFKARKYLNDRTYK